MKFLSILLAISTIFAGYFLFLQGANIWIFLGIGFVTAVILLLGYLFPSSIVLFLLALVYSVLIIVCFTFDVLSAGVGTATGLLSFLFLYIYRLRKNANE